MKIKSITDVITNSSSEVFVIKTEKTAKEIYNELETMRNPEENCSGEGGVITVRTNDTFEGNEPDYYAYPVIEGYARIVIDYGYKTLLEYLRPQHCEYVEDAIDIKNCLNIDINWLNKLEITPKMLEVIPDIKDTFVKFLKAANKVYENTFNN